MTNRNFPCSDCSQSFRDKADLKRHASSVHKGWVHTCPLCDKNFLRKPHLLKHMRTHADDRDPAGADGSKPVERRSFCGVCEQRFVDIEAVSEHQCLVHHICRLCSQRFPERRSLLRHVMEHKDDEPLGSQPRAVSVGGPSNLASVGGPSNLAPVGGASSLSCPVCQQEFTGTADLEKHLLVHTRLLLTPFICGECKLGYVNKCDLLLHQSVVHLICRVCSQRFSHRKSLLQHVKSHAEEQRSEKSSGSQRHQATAQPIAQESPQKCYVCEQTLATLSELDEHMKGHTGRKESLVNLVDRLLTEPFLSRSYEERLKIKEQGRPTPQLQVSPGQEKMKRHFHSSWYEKLEWLCGSALKNRMFCWPCLLMKPRGRRKAGDVWETSGFMSLKSFHVAHRAHERQSEHVSASLRLSSLGRITVENQDQGKTNWTFLSRLIDTASLLARQELLGRGAKGNFRALAHTVAKYDALLGAELQSSGTSLSFQNPLLCAIANIVSEQIRTELDKVPFFSWQVDEAMDSSCEPQISVLLRFVDSSGQIQERLLGLLELPHGRDAPAVFQVLHEAMKSLNYAEKLVSQSYCGALVSASSLQELAALVREQAPSAVLVHHCGQSLTQVLAQGSKCFPQCRVFFATLYAISHFFCSSAHRRSMLNSSSLKWDVSSVLSTVADHYQTVLKTLERILSDPGSEDQDLDSAQGFLLKMTEFDFVFLLQTYNHIFSVSSAFSELLHTSMDVPLCQSRLNALLFFVRESKAEETFHTVYSTALELAEEEPTEEEPRRKGRDSEGEEPKQTYRVLYLEIMDNLLLQLTQRFASLEDLAFIDVLNPAKFEERSKRTYPDDLLQNLLRTYGPLFDPLRVRSEIRLLLTERYLQEGVDVSELLLNFKQAGLDSAMPNLYKLMSLVATIGATAAGARGRFGRAQRVQSFLHRDRDGSGSNSDLDSGLDSGSDSGSRRALVLLALEKNLVKDLEKLSGWHERVTQNFLENQQREFMAALNSDSAI